MAYGMLAGMPPVYGLYSSISPSLVYLCLGTCKHLQLGTNAPISLLVADGTPSTPLLHGVTRGPLEPRWWAAVCVIG